MFFFNLMFPHLKNSMTTFKALINGIPIDLYKEVHDLSQLYGIYKILDIIYVRYKLFLGYTIWVFASFLSVYVHAYPLPFFIERSLSADGPNTVSLGCKTEMFVFMPDLYIALSLFSFKFLKLNQ